VDGQDRRRHHGGHQHRGERRDEPEREQDAAGDLGRSGADRVQLARPQPERVEEACGAAHPVAAEQAEQLLGPVADEQRAHDDPQDQQSKFHDSPLCDLVVHATT
jgi:hypothetical protein